MPGRALLHAHPDERDTPVSQLLAGVRSDPGRSSGIARVRAWRELARRRCIPLRPYDASRERPSASGIDMGILSYRKIVKAVVGLIRRAIDVPNRLLQAAQSEIEPLPRSLDNAPPYRVTNRLQMLASIAQTIPVRSSLSSKPSFILHKYLAPTRHHKLQPSEAEVGCHGRACRGHPRLG